MKEELAAASSSQTALPQRDVVPAPHDPTETRHQTINQVIHTELCQFREETAARGKHQPGDMVMVAGPISSHKGEKVQKCIIVVHR